MGTEGRRATLRKICAGLERWAWRALLCFLVLAVLVAIFLVLGSGTGGSGR
jgi:hypothetical protein